MDELEEDLQLKEKQFQMLIHQTHVTVHMTIDEIKLLMDQKRPDTKFYPYSICDLWLRLKTIERMETLILVKCLKFYQLRREPIEMNYFNDYNDNDVIPTNASALANPRRSRLFHCHISADSDRFDLNQSSYVGLMLFSYDQQSKFNLNGRLCQRGDILIKKLEFFNPQIQQGIANGRRGFYEVLFRWFFARPIDDRFFGVGFLYNYDQWRFETISSDPHQWLLPYEYRILDMFLLTHWLTNEPSARHVQEMEIQAKLLITKQYLAVKQRMNERKNRTELIEVWNDTIGSDQYDLSSAIGQFCQTINDEIDKIFTEILIVTK